MRRRRQKALPPVKVGSVTIPRYQLGDGRVMIAYPTATQKRKCQTFTDAAEAKDEAERIARELHNGGSEAQIFASADRADFSQALRDVAPHGIPVHVATSEWSEAKKKINGLRHSLAEVVAAGVEVLSRKPHPVPDVVEAMLRSKAPQDLHAGWRDSMAATLRRFGQAFPGDIREVKAAAIQIWLDGRDEAGIHVGGLRKRNGEPVGTRRRDNILKEVRLLFRYARLHSMLPDVISEPQKVPLIDEGPAAISYFSVSEARLILEQVRPEWQPFVVLILFNGFRTDELVKARNFTKRKDPLRWEDLDWDEREIIVRDVTSKVRRTRVVPFHQITMEWLLPYRQPRGYIAPQKRIDREFGRGVRLERAINRLLNQAPRLRESRPLQLDMPGLTEASPAALLTEFAWRKNALRHSYGSYRASILKNEHELAEEMGTSVAMIRKHYRNPRPMSEARAYFGLRPQIASTIVPFVAGDAV